MQLSPAEKVSLATAEPTSSIGKERLEIQSNAEKAVAAADIAMLRAAYDRAVADRAETESALRKVSEIAMREHKPNDVADAVKAVRDIALAAIRLAESVLLDRKSE